jgi:hypothetical protein
VTQLFGMPFFGVRRIAADIPPELGMPHPKLDHGVVDGIDAGHVDERVGGVVVAHADGEIHQIPQREIDPLAELQLGALPVAQVDIPPDHRMRRVETEPAPIDPAQQLDHHRRLDGAGRQKALVLAITETLAVRCSERQRNADVTGFLLLNVVHERLPARRNTAVH